MGAIPALELPDGSLLTESAAMVLHISDTHPEAHLMPPSGTSERAQAYRWLLFLATSGYGAALRRFHPADNTTDPTGGGGGGGEGGPRSAPLSCHHERRHKRRPVSIRRHLYGGGSLPVDAGRLATRPG